MSDTDTFCEASEQSAIDCLDAPPSGRVARRRAGLTKGETSAGPVRRRSSEQALDEALQGLGAAVVSGAGVPRERTTARTAAMNRGHAERTERSHGAPRRDDRRAGALAQRSHQQGEAEGTPTPIDRHGRHCEGLFGPQHSDERGERRAAEPAETTTLPGASLQFECVHGSDCLDGSPRESSSSCSHAADIDKGNPRGATAARLLRTISR